MRALWSDRPNCSHNVSQKVKRIRRFSEFKEIWGVIILATTVRPAEFSCVIPMAFRDPKILSKGGLLDESHMDCQA